MGFIKIHILYHASLGSIYGMELIEELQKHNYQVSPGLIYPTLHSLEKNDYLKSEKRVIGGKVRRYYNITAEGVNILEEAKQKVKELVQEVMQ